MKSAAAKIGKVTHEIFFIIMDLFFQSGGAGGCEVDFIIINIMEQKFVVTEVEDLREDEEERSGGSSSRT